MGSTPTSRTTCCLLNRSSSGLSEYLACLIVAWGVRARGDERQFVTETLWVSSLLIAAHLKSGIAQLVRAPVCGTGGEGSIPSPRTSSRTCGRGEMADAPDLGSGEGNPQWEFESPRPHHSCLRYMSAVLVRFAHLHHFRRFPPSANRSGVQSVPFTLPLR